MKIFPQACLWRQSQLTLDTLICSGTINGVRSSSSSHILIQNNTCEYYQDIGIIVFGVDNESEAGEVDLINNIVSGSYQYGISWPSGWLIFNVHNTGYYLNDEDKDWGFNEYNPVYETQSPYVNGLGILPYCYLRQNSNFINASNQYIEATHLIGKTTDTNGFPDSNKTDIGFHYPNWHYSNADDSNIVTMDLNADLVVNFKDLAAIAHTWRTNYNIDDLNKMADEWLKRAGEPNFYIHITGDSNDGYIDIGLSGFVSDAIRTFLLIDGRYIGEFPCLQTAKTINLDISNLGNGLHWLKAINLSDTDKIVCSNLSETSFTCSFNYCIFNGSYEYNESDYFQTFYQGSGNVNVKIYNKDSALIWSQTYSGQNINGYIPSSITSRDDLRKIVFEPASIPAASIAKPLSIKFNPKKVPLEVRALIILPDSNLNELGKDIIETVINTYNIRLVPYWKLELGNATYENLAWLAWNRNIQYIYFSGHGGYTDPNNIFFRTWIRLDDIDVVSVKESDFPPGYAPPWCTKMPDIYERSLKSIYKLGFTSGAQLKYVYFDSCYSGRLKITGDNRLIEGPGGYDGIYSTPYSDMSYALGMLGVFDQFYQGWWGYMWTGPDAPSNTFGIDEWTKLKEGEDLYDALKYAIDRTVWHPAGWEARDNLRVYGIGLMIGFKIE